jgi:chaperonin GroES
MKLLSDRVLVEPFSGQNVTKGGIFIPDTARKPEERGTVMSIGDGLPDRFMTVKVGDVVLYGKHIGTPTVVEGKTLLMIREIEISAIIG